jgi:hypothetical protein
MLSRGPIPNFYAAFLTAHEDDVVPLLKFTVFDKEEVVTRAPYDFGEEPGYVAIRNREIAGLFVAYFDKLWSHSKKITKKEDIEMMLRALDQHDLYACPPATQAHGSETQARGSDATQNAEPGQ